MQTASIENLATKRVTHPASEHKHFPLLTEADTIGDFRLCGALSSFTKSRHHVNVDRTSSSYLIVCRQTAIITRRFPLFRSTVSNP